MGNSLTTDSRCDRCRLSFLCIEDLNFHLNTHTCSHCDTDVADYYDLQIHLITSCSNQEQLYLRTRGLSYMAVCNDNRSQAKYEERASILAEFKAFSDARRGSVSALSSQRLYDSKVQTDRSVYVYGGDLTAAMPLSVEVALRLLHGKKCGVDDLNEVIQRAVIMDQLKPGDGTFQRTYADNNRYKDSLQVIGEMKSSTREEDVFSVMIERIHAYSRHTSVVAIFRRKLDTVAVYMNTSREIILFDPCMAISEMPSNALINMVGAGLLYFCDVKNLVAHLNRAFPYVSGRDENQEKMFNTFELTVFRRAEWEWEDLCVEMPTELFSSKCSSASEDGDVTPRTGDVTPSNSSHDPSSPSIKVVKFGQSLASRIEQLDLAAAERVAARGTSILKRTPMMDTPYTNAASDETLTSFTTPTLETPTGLAIDIDASRAREALEAEKRENGALRAQLHDALENIRFLEQQLHQQGELFNEERDELLTNFNASKSFMEEEIMSLRAELQRYRPADVVPSPGPVVQGEMLYQDTSHQYYQQPSPPPAATAEPVPIRK